jgi:hypothetical protein
VLLERGISAGGRLECINYDDGKLYQGNIQVRDMGLIKRKTKPSMPNVSLLAIYISFNHSEKLQFRDTLPEPISKDHASDALVTD